VTVRLRSQRTGSPVRRLPLLLGSLLAGSLVLTACTGDGSEMPPADVSSAAVDTDSVQTDPPVRTPAVVVTFAEFAPATQRIEAAAHVQGLLETGGTCTLTAVPADGSEAVVDEGRAEPGAATTDCGELRVDTPEGSTGTWQVSVTYSSPTTELSSPTIEVQIP
jgi:hypothetical protein